MYRGYYLGCPIWGNKDWVGELFSEDARQKDFLRQFHRLLSAHVDAGEMPIRPGDTASKRPGQMTLF